MKKNLWVVLLSLCAIVAGCDLQPKIASIPDGVGDFISERYPTLLAEPDSEIYQSAVADYGVYASPTLYGNSNGEDYVLYSATGDYIMPEQPVADTTDTTDTVDTADTGNVADDVTDDVTEPDTPTDDVLVVGDRAAHDTADTTDEEKPTAEEYGFTPDDDVQDLKIPDYVTPKKAEEKPTPVAKQDVKDTKPGEAKKAETKKVETKKAEPKPEPKAEQKTVAPAKAEPAKSNEIVVAKGDTLYSLARKHSLTVDELAAANKLKSPYALSVGQKLKLPVADKKPDAVARVADKKVEPKPVAKAETKPAPKAESKPEVKPVAKPVAKKPETKKPEVKKPEPAKQTAVVRVPLREVTVAKGDTLYSISRKYSVAVNDLATINKLSAPFALSVGQKIKVPDLAGAQKKTDAKPVAKTTTETKKTVAPAQKKDTKKADVKPAPKAATKPAVKGDAKKTAKTPVKKTETKKAEPKKTAAKQTAQKKQETPKTNKKAQPMVARSSSKFSWPVRGKILSGYGAKSNGLFNDGINIKAARGTTVVAAENGFVAYAGNEVKGMGNLVIIQHADGWMTVYAHMDSMTVRRGHKVTVGQKIGTVGTSGKVDQAQLHFEIRKGTKAYNPVNYLKK